MEVYVDKSGDIYKQIFDTVTEGPVTRKGRIVPLNRANPEERLNHQGLMKETNDDLAFLGVTTTTPLMNDRGGRLSHHEGSSSGNWTDPAALYALRPQTTTSGWDSVETSSVVGSVQVGTEWRKWQEEMIEQNLLHEHWLNFGPLPFGLHVFIGLLMVLTAVCAIVGNGLVLWCLVR